jgi:hypothetical protein
MPEGGEDRMARASMIARDDQQTAAILDCAEVIEDFLRAAGVCAAAMEERGVPTYMIVSQMTGMVATALHQLYGGKGPE